MTSLTEEELRWELEQGIVDLQSSIAWDLPLQSFAYPYEMWNEEVWEVVRQYHRYARAGDGGVPVPPNPVPLNDARYPEWGHLTAKAPTRYIPVASWDTWVVHVPPVWSWVSISVAQGHDFMVWEQVGANAFRVSSIPDPTQSITITPYP